MTDWCYALLRIKLGHLQFNPAVQNTGSRIYGNCGHPTTLQCYYQAHETMKLCSTFFVPIFHIHSLEQDQLTTELKSYSPYVFIRHQHNYHYPHYLKALHSHTLNCTSHSPLFLQTSLRDTWPNIFSIQLLPVGSSQTALSNHHKLNLL